METSELEAKRKEVEFLESQGDLYVALLEKLGFSDEEIACALRLQGRLQ